MNCGMLIQKWQENHILLVMQKHIAGLHVNIIDVLLTMACAHVDDQRRQSNSVGGSFHNHNLRQPGATHRIPAQHKTNHFLRENNNANRLEMVFNRVGSWFITGLPADNRIPELLYLGTNRGLR